MLHATEVLGAKTYDSHGHYVGRVKELFIDPAEQQNRIARVLLSRGQFRPLLARYDQVASVTPGEMKLTTDESALELYQPNEGWLAMSKDLLDQQIIDMHGRKVVRVNDIDIAEHKTNGNMEMKLADVDVGLAGAVRRLLQGLVSPHAIRKIQAKLPPRKISWEFVNLIEPDPLRRVKLRITGDSLARLHPADLADIMEDLSPAERQSVFTSLDEESAAEAIAELDSRLQVQILERLEPEKAAHIIEEMPPDEAADVLNELTQEKSDEVLAEMPEAREVRDLLKFDPDTAGGMMNTEVVIVGKDATRDEVVKYIRDNEIALDQLDNVFLNDDHMKFAGSVRLVRLVLATPDQKMTDLINNVLVSVPPNASSNEVFELFDKYNLRSLCVVDPENRPIGAITVDDVVSHLMEKV
jgi:CBS domain-containing protein/sporulation protein YlmC with PRC-barrel domain